MNGWEPGRNTEQVIRDQRDGKQIPDGFWHEDLTPAMVPDSIVHHPCGSPLKRTPCTSAQKAKDDTTAAAVGNLNDASAVSRDSIWVDPMPTDVIVSENNARSKAELANEKAKAAAAGSTASSPAAGSTAGSQAG